MSKTVTFLRKRANRAGLAAMAADTSAALDKAYFAQHPDRENRARLATPQELAKLAACGAMPDVPDGMAVWAVIRQLASGVRWRDYRAAAVPFWLIHDIPEDVARHMFHGKESD